MKYCKKKKVLSNSKMLPYSYSKYNLFCAKDVLSCYTLAKAKRIKLETEMIGLSFQTQKEFVDIKAKVLKESSLHTQDDTSVQHYFQVFEA